MNRNHNGSSAEVPALDDTIIGQGILWLTIAAMLVVSFDVAVNEFAARGPVPVVQIAAALLAAMLGAAVVVSRSKARPGAARAEMADDDPLVIDLRDHTGAMKPVAQAIVRHHASVI